MMYAYIHAVLCNITPSRCVRMRLCSCNVCGMRCALVYNISLAVNRDHTIIIIYYVMCSTRCVFGFYIILLLKSLSRVFRKILHRSMYCSQCSVWCSLEIVLTVRVPRKTVYEVYLCYARWSNILRSMKYER